MKPEEIRAKMTELSHEEALLEDKLREVKKSISLLREGCPHVNTKGHSGGVYSCLDCESVFGDY